MIKEKDILIRIDSNLKKKVQEKAKSLGLSLSAYVRSLIIKELKNE
jgi:antitoxin component of RelBE/YafQ-DinJ toxin-antitoxin module